MAQNFKISVDDKELEKAFDSLEKKAKSLEETMVEIGKDVDSAFDVSDLSEYTSSLEKAKDMLLLLDEARKKQYQDYHNLKFDKESFGIVTEEEVNKSLHNLNLMDNAIEELKKTIASMESSNVDFSRVGIGDLDAQADAIFRYGRMIDELVNSQQVAEERLSTFMSNITDATPIKEIIKEQELYVSSLEGISYKLSAISVKGQDDLTSKQLSKIDSITKSLNEELKYTKVRIAEIGQESDKTAKKVNTYLTQMRGVREQMAQLVSEDGSVSKENLTRYDELKARLGELGTAYRRVQNEQKLVTQAGNSMVAGITQGLQAIAGTFTLVQGISAMFTDDAEKIQEIQKKLQTAMAITMGIQQVSTALHATSNFRIGLVTKATMLWDTAQKTLNTSLGIGAGLSKALVTGGVMLLVTAIGYVVTQYSKWSEEQKKLKDLSSDFLKTISSEVSEAYRLFDALKGVSKESKEYAEITKEINSKYGSKLANQKDEIRNLIDIDASQKAVIKSLIELSKAKGLEESMTKASSKFTEEWSDALNEASQLFRTKFGKEEGAKQFSMFSEGILASGGVVTDELQGIYDKFKFGFKSASLTSESVNGEFNSLAGVISKTKEAFDNYSESVNFYKTIFKSNISDTDKYIGLLGIQQKKLEDLKKQYGEVSNINNEETLKEYNKEKKRIEDEINRLSNLGVKSIKPEKNTKEEKSYESSIKEQAEKLIRDREELDKLRIDEKIKRLQYEGEKEIEKITEVKNKAVELNKKADIKILEERESITLQKYEELIKKELEIEGKKNVEALKKFETRIKREAEIKDKYNKLRLLAEGDPNIDTSLIDKSEKEELKKLSKEFNKDSVKSAKDIAKIFGDLSLKTAKELLDAIKQVEKEIASTTDPVQLEAWQSMMDRLTKTLGDKAPFQAMFREIEEGAKSIGEGGSKNVAKGVGQISGTIKKVLPEVQKLSDATREIFGDEFADNIDGAIKSFEMLAEVGEGVSKVMSGDILGGSIQAISGISKLVGHMRKVNKEHREALKMLELQAKTMRVQYSIMQMQKKLNESQTGILGIDRYGASLVALREYNNALEQTNELIKGDRIPKDQTMFGITFNRKELEAYEKDLLALYDIEIVTGSRKSGWGFWKKRKDTYSSILDVYDDLIDAEGRLNVARAESILQNEKMSDEDRRNLELIVESAKQAEEAYKQMDAYFTSIFGSLSDDLMKSVIDAFASGENAMNDFGDSATKMMQKLASDMVYYLAFSEIFEDAEDKFKKIRDDSSKSEEQKLQDYQDTIEQMKKSIEDKVDYANSLLEISESIIGTDFTSDKVPTSSQGYQVQMSQETGDEISGMVRGMQMTLLNQESEMIKQTDILSTFGMQFGSMQQELQAISNATLQGVYYLQDIEKHTRILPTFSDKLDKIEQNTR